MLGYVYYDESYPTSWISIGVAKIIVDHLKKFDFEVVNASELRKTMDYWISQRDVVEEVVIVFSQDIVPETILDDPASPTASSPIRRFLNAGHSIVWMGDVPLLYVGFSDGGKQSLAPNFRQTVLGLNPNVQNVNRVAKLTHYGKSLGLPPWIGKRPTPSPPPSQPPYMQPIAQNPADTNYHGYVAYYSQPFSGVGFIRIYDFEMDKPEKMDERLLRGIVCACYGGMHNLIQRELQSLQIDIRNTRELLKTLEAKFNSFKSELDALNPKLDEILETLKGGKEKSP